MKMKYGRHLADFRAAFFDIGNTCFNQVHGQIPPANIDQYADYRKKAFTMSPILSSCWMSQLPIPAIAIRI